MSLTKLLAAAGSVALAVAIVWWWTTFGDVVGYGYLSGREAGRCLIGDSDLCALARTLCLGAHPKTLIPYSAAAFWLAVGCFSISLLTPRSRNVARP